MTFSGLGLVLGNSVRRPCCLAEQDTQTEQRSFMVSSPLTSVLCLELQGGSGRRLATLWDVSYIIVVSGDEDSKTRNRMLYGSMIGGLTKSRRDGTGHRRRCDGGVGNSSRSSSSCENSSSSSSRRGEDRRRSISSSSISSSSGSSSSSSSSSGATFSRRRRRLRRRRPPRRCRRCCCCDSIVD